jgi:hypothetical protein
LPQHCAITPWICISSSVLLFVLQLYILLVHQLYIVCYGSGRGNYLENATGVDHHQSPAITMRVAGFLRLFPSVSRLFSRPPSLLGASLHQYCLGRMPIRGNPLPRLSSRPSLPPGRLPPSILPREDAHPWESPPSAIFASLPPSWAPPSINIASAGCPSVGISFLPSAGSAAGHWPHSTYVDVPYCSRYIYLSFNTVVHPQKNNRKSEKNTKKIPSHRLNNRNRSR